MNSVVSVIAEYLESNRRLVIPTFGAFVVKESGEYIFSDLLSVDDGVLTSLLRATGLNEMEAAITIDRFIFEVRHELESFGYCRLGKVGTLRVEPSTKVLRLYPPVQGEMPKRSPYIPRPISEIENETRKIENENNSMGGEAKTATAPNVSALPRQAIKSRKRVDVVMVVAIVILLIALAGIGYGWYVSNMDMIDDDAAMEALRVVPGQNVNE